MALLSRVRNRILAMILALLCSETKCLSSLFLHYPWSICKHFTKCYGHNIETGQWRTQVFLMSTSTGLSPSLYPNTRQHLLELEYILLDSVFVPNLITYCLTRLRGIFILQLNYIFYGSLTKTSNNIGTNSSRRFQEIKFSPLHCLLLYLIFIPVSIFRSFWNNRRENP